MKCEWRNSVLGDFVQIKGGKRLPKGIGLQTIPNSHPYIRIRDMGKCKILNLNSDYEYVDNITQKSISRYIVNEGDIVISIVGTIGLVGIVGSSLNDANLTENCARLINSGKLDRDYLYYYLISDVGQSEIRRGIVGAVQPKLPIKNIQNISIRFPVGVHFQKKIAKVLSALDDKIELNNQINKNLEEQANALFDNMFPNISQGNKTVGDYIVPKRGKSLLSKDAVLGDVPVVAGGLEPSTYHNESNTTAPVITISASGANAGYVSLWHIPVWSSDSSYIDSKMSDSVYFWYVLLKKRQNEIYDSQTGSAQPHIYPQHIAELPLSELRLESISLFNIRVTSLFAQIANNKAENAILHKTRDTLLPKLMSGEIDVDNVEI